MKIIIVFLTLSLAIFKVAASPQDSIRIEVVKGQKYIIHKVVKGETVPDLAKRYKVLVADIIKVNELEKNNTLTKNQLIKIPLKPDTKLSTDSTRVDEAHANAQAQEQNKVYTHQVQVGETVNSISKKYKITTAQLVKWNNIRNNKIGLGQILIVDESATAKPYQKLNGSEAQLPVNNTMPKLAEGDLIQQAGIAIVDETMQVLHPEAPIGTIIKVINTENYKQCLVKVTGQLDNTKYKNFIISIGKEAQEKLETNSATIRVKLVYLIKSQ